MNIYKIKLFEDLVFVRFKVNGKFEYLECTNPKDIKGKTFSLDIFPKNKKVYKIKVEGVFKLWECKDPDCPINGCKHSSCYKVRFYDSK